MFSVEQRNQIHDQVLQLAASDKRVVAGAVVGSLAFDEADRWSDLDLTFAVADDQPMLDVLEDWSRSLTNQFGAVQLFDLPAGPSIYRVFLLPGCLQFDLSFTPASQFGAIGPKFKLLFGQAAEKVHVQLPSASLLFGYAVHHAVRARFCIERGRFWQAEYWISGVRDYALNLACRRRGLTAAHGRGYDDLPVEVRDRFAKSLVSSPERTHLLAALRCAVEGLLLESEEVEEMARKIKPQLDQLVAG